MPQLTEVGDLFLCNNYYLRQLDLPQLKKVGNEFLSKNKKLSEINLPQLEETGWGFLYFNTVLRRLYLPKLKQIAGAFIESHPQREQLIDNMHKKSEKNEDITDITPKEIAEVDKDNQLTTTEVSLARKNIEKIKSIFHKKDNSQR